MPPAASLPVLINGAAPGAIVQLEGLLLQLWSAKPFPPGQPLQLRVTALEPALQLEGRSLGSKRSPDGTYALRLRLINLQKPSREALERAWASIERG